MLQNWRKKQVRGLSHIPPPVGDQPGTPPREDSRLTESPPAPQWEQLIPQSLTEQSLQDSPKEEGKRPEEEEGSHRSYLKHSFDVGLKEIELVGLRLYYDWVIHCNVGRASWSYPPEGAIDEKDFKGDLAFTTLDPLPSSFSLLPPHEQIRAHNEQLAAAVRKIDAEIERLRQSLF